MRHVWLRILRDGREARVRVREMADDRVGTAWHVVSRRQLRRALGLWSLGLSRRGDELAWFEFCVSDDGDWRWCRLEGLTGDLWRVVGVRL